MEHKNLWKLVAFKPEKMQKIPLFITDKMFIDLYCLLPGQFQKVHSHANEDKVYVILEGEGLFDIDGEQKNLSNGETVIARAGMPHGVRNVSEKNLVLLVTMSPKPLANEKAHA